MTKRPGAPLQLPPGERVRQGIQSLGERAFIAGCIELLRGAPGDAHPILLEYLGGAHARTVLAGSQAEPWPRVWAARALLYVWHDGAGGAVRDGLTDEAWRVREMCAKVVALRELGAAADELLPLLEDPVPRVRAAAARAAGVVGESEHAEALHALTDDPEHAVRRRAEEALVHLGTRIDRDL